MTKEVQKIIELSHLEVFKSLLSEFPKGHVRQGENPDFIVHSTERKLGVEHTLIYKKEADKRSKQSSNKKQEEMLPQTYESYQDDIVATAKEHADLNGIPHAWVDICFKKNMELGRKVCSDLAEKIILGIGKVIHSENDIDQYKSFNVNKEDLPEEILFIQFHLLGEDKPSLWRSVHGIGWGMTNTIEPIKKGIQRKAEKYSMYMDKCSECWLLLVADSKASSFIHPNLNSLDYVYCSPFDRTYFMDCSESKLYLLKTRWAWR